MTLSTVSLGLRCAGTLGGPSPRWSQPSAQPGAAGGVGLRVTFPKRVMYGQGFKPTFSKISSKPQHSGCSRFAAALRLAGKPFRQRPALGPGGGSAWFTWKADTRQCGRMRSHLNISREKQISRLGNKQFQQRGAEFPSVALPYAARGPRKSRWHRRDLLWSCHGARGPSSAAAVRWAAAGFLTSRSLPLPLCCRVRVSLGAGGKPQEGG